MENENRKRESGEIRGKRTEMRERPTHHKATTLNASIKPTTQKPQPLPTIHNPPPVQNPNPSTKPKSKNPKVVFNDCWHRHPPWSIVIIIVNPWTSVA